MNSHNPAPPRTGRVVIPPRSPALSNDAEAFATDTLTVPDPAQTGEEEVRRDVPTVSVLDRVPGVSLVRDIGYAASDIITALSRVPMGRYLEWLAVFYFIAHGVFGFFPHDRRIVYVYSDGTLQEVSASGETLTTKPKEKQ